MARVHPGESNSSLVLKGAVDFLLSDTRVARLLRRHFVFRVIPMLNPDGVIYGNTRTSLVGADLNRRWNSPSETLHPSLYYTKRLIQMMSEEREVALVCDFHGHSIKKKVFMYGCRHFQPDLPQRKSNALIKLLPLLLSRKTKLFSYRNCRFNVTKDRVATSRIVFFREMGIDRSYTLETSFYGPLDDGVAHMEERHFEEVGRELCALLLTFVNRRVFRRRVQEAVQEVKTIKSQRDIRQPPPTKAESEENKQESEGNLLGEMEKSGEEFVLEDAMNELTEFHEELNASSESEDSEDTESSESSDDDRKVTPTQKDYQSHEPEKPILKPLPRKLEKPLRLSRPFSRPRVQRQESRSQSPVVLKRGESIQAESSPLIKMKDVPSKYLQYQSNPVPSRPKPSTDLIAEELSFPLASVSIKAEQLRNLEIPNARVVIARSAGAFRSALKGRTVDPFAIMRPTTSNLEPHTLKMNRIQSTLFVRKKLLWKPEEAKLNTRLPRTGGGFRNGEDKEGEVSPGKEAFDPMRTVG